MYFLNRDKKANHEKQKKQWSRENWENGISKRKQMQTIFEERSDKLY